MKNSTPKAVLTVPDLLCILATNDNLNPPVRIKPLISRANLCNEDHT